MTEIQSGHKSFESLKLLMKGTLILFAGQCIVISYKKGKIHHQKSILHLVSVLISLISMTEEIAFHTFVGINFFSIDVKNVLLPLDSTDNVIVK